MNTLRPLAAGALLALGLTACGAGSTASSPPAARASAPSATATPSATAAPSAPSASPSGQPAEPARTQVITYAPWAGPGTLTRGISAAATRSGSCFTTSSATNAPGAYRCFVGNLLLDPCFADATTAAGEVACPSPENPDSVVVIRLTASLPPPATGAGPRIPWLLVLANGQQCETITGTGGVLGGKNEAYGCPGGDVYGLPDRSAATWMVSYAPSGAPASGMIQEAVTKAYE